MRLFEEPIVEVQKFDVEDIITTSLGENNLPNQNAADLDAYT